MKIIGLLSGMSWARQSLATSKLTVPWAEGSVVCIEHEADAVAGEHCQSGFFGRHNRIEL